MGRDSTRIESLFESLVYGSHWIDKVAASDPRLFKAEPHTLYELKGASGHRALSLDVKLGMAHTKVVLFEALAMIEHIPSWRTRRQLHAANRERGA
jgi:hypothetical protein